MQLGSANNLIFRNVKKLGWKKKLSIRFIMAGIDQLTGETQAPKKARCVESITGPKILASG